MPRRRVAAKREILPDPKFSSELLAKFINCVMRSGKKSIAEKIVYGALNKVDERQKSNAEQKNDEGSSNAIQSSTLVKGYLIELFDKALENIRPTVEVRARRVGGSTYQIPVEVRPSRRTALAMRWLVVAAQSRGGKNNGLKVSR